MLIATRSSAVERQLAGLSAADFCRRGAQAQGGFGRVAAGEAFLLQGGDCAESFAEHSADNIRDFFRVLLQVAVVLTFAAALAGCEGRADRWPVRQAALLADREARRQELPSYRGDIINDIAFTPEARGPDPRRQIEAYRQSAATLNLCAPSRWRLRQPGERPPLDARLRQGLAAVARTGSRRTASRRPLNFMRACGIDPENHPELRTTDFYTSHEALLLGFEQAMTHVDSTTG